MDELHSTHIKTAGRIDSDKEAGLPVKLTGKDNLLYIASGEGSCCRHYPWAPYIKALDKTLCILLLFLLLHDSLIGELLRGDILENKILHDGE